MYNWSTLKKLIWLYAAKLKGGAQAIIETITGTLPLVLQNALSHAILSLTRYGLCTQDGTPTPSTPADIVCNNGALRVRRQSGLPLGYQMVEWLIPTGAIPIMGFKTKSTQEITTVFYRENSAACYLYSSDTSASGTTNTTAYLTSTGGNWRWNGKTLAPAITAGAKTSVQSANGLYFNGSKWGSYTDAGEFVSTNDLSVSSSGNTGTRIYSLTVREGETVTLDLVPVQRVTDNAYGFYDKVSGNFYTNANATFEAGDPIDDPVEIYTDGTPEVLTVRGKNLYNKADGVVSGYPSATGRWNSRSGESSELSIIVKLEEGKTYTAQRADGANCPFRVMGSANRPLTNGQSLQVISAPSAISYNETTFTVPSGYPYIVFYVRNNAGATLTIDDIINAFQVELGSTATAYEPYVTPQTVNDVPMLLSVGDYKDAVELISGIKTGKVGVKVFDGTERFTVSSSGAMITAIPDVAIGAQNVPMNTHFALETSPTAIAVGKQRFGASGDKIYSANYYMKHTSITNAADFKTWLAAQYAAGTPVIVIYPLATETTEQTTPQHLVTNRGTNVVEAEANVEPVDLEIVYAKEG